MRPVMDPRRAGVGNYAMSLVTAMAGQAQEHEFRLFSSGWSTPSGASAIGAHRADNVRECHARVPNKLFNASTRLLHWPSVERLCGAPDVFLHPNLSFLSMRGGAPRVLTVHDLAFIRFAGFYSPKRWLWHRLAHMGRAVAQAAGIIAVSEHTKQDVIETFGVSEDRVRVIHSGLDQRFAPVMDAHRLRSLRDRYDLPESFILSVGTIEPRKNVGGLIAAHATLADPPALAIAGARGWLCRDVFEQSRSSPHRDRIRFLGYVPGPDLPTLYSAATIFAYPSFYEGFGFPPLEAMACGTPVLASPTSSLPEVLGRAASYADPSNVSDLARGMHDLLGSAEHRGRLRQAGLRQAARYRWSETAAQTLRYCRELARP